MKKLFLMASLLMMGGAVLTSCDNNDDVTMVGDGDTYSIARDITGSFTAANGYKLQTNITLQGADVVLVYRKTMDGTTAVWSQVPRTLYLAEGELDYDFDFTAGDVQIYAGGGINFGAQNQTFLNTYLNNQTFRVVLVPASFGKNANVDYSDYKSVAKYYNIQEDKIQNTKK